MTGYDLHLRLYSGGTGSPTCGLPILYVQLWPAHTVRTVEGPICHDGFMVYKCAAECESEGEQSAVKHCTYSRDNTSTDNCNVRLASDFIFTFT